MLRGEMSQGETFQGEMSCGVKCYRALNFRYVMIPAMEGNFLLISPNGTEIILQNFIPNILEDLIPFS